LVELKSGTPVVVLYGEPDVGNTTYNRKRLPWVCLGLKLAASGGWGGNILSI